MKNLHRFQKIFTARWLCTGLFALVLFSRLSALAEERWLFVFDTSSAMKKRLPAVETEIKNLFATSISENLHTGDSVGVWTFSQKLHVGEFPLTTWAPEDSARTAASFIAFLRKQNYSGDTSFAALQPLLGQVIADSERLNVVIFCDGAGEIHWTPYDDDINETLRLTGAERKKSRQPFVLLLRTQHGKYIGSTVNFPPLPLNIPPFPPPPEIKIVPASPPPKPVAPVAATPPVVIPPLIIVGTKVSSDTNDLPQISAAPTNPIPAEPVKTNTKTNTMTVEIQKTNSISEPPLPVLASNVPPAKTNVIAVAPTDETSAPASADNDTRILIYVGVGLFASAIVLVILLVARSRRAPHGSLITTSMQNDLRPPEKK